MSLIYLDQNALIGLGFKAGNAQFRKKLDGAIESGGLTITVSTWHLVETANSPNLASAIRLAEFMDTLRPKWLFERHNLQKMDVQEDFLTFLKIDHRKQPRVTTLSAVIAALHAAQDAPKFDLASRDFVKQWIEHPEQMRPLKESYEKNAESLIGLRAAVKAGKLTEAVRRQTDEILAKISMPRTTPAGLDYGREVKIDYVQQFKAEGVPSIAIESAISEKEWGADAIGGVDRNTFIDKVHLISALPWVDEIVSNDKFFSQIYPVAQASGHVRAKLVRNDEFMAQFT
jgi:hypothetical protein